jgi:drug/metabolite transporter (DMT)-like permease
MSMFLGTSRRWWLAAALPLLLGLVLLVTSDGTVLRTAAAILLLLLAMVLFGMAPMRYGQSARTPATLSDETPAATTSATIDAPRSRPSIVGRDSAEV